MGLFVMARPSDYSVELADDICLRISGGESLRSVCRDEQMPDKTTVLRWLRKHEEFRTQYAIAREDLIEHWAEEIVDIADDGTNDFVEKERADGSKFETVDSEHINRSRLRVDTRKWLMARMAPKKYGDRVTQEISGPGGGPIETVELSEQEAARRIAFTLAKATQPTTH